MKLRLAHKCTVRNILLFLLLLTPYELGGLFYRHQMPAVLCCTPRTGRASSLSRLRALKKLARAELSATFRGPHINTLY